MLQSHFSMKGTTFNTLMPSPNNKEYEVLYNFDTQDIVNNILIADARSYKETRLLANKFSKNDLYKLWKFVKSNIRYKEDRANQIVQHPAKLWKDKKGDCKSFSVFIGTILKNLGIPYTYRFVAYKPGDVTHVYVVATVDGTPIILDAVHNKFNDEIPFHHGYDYKPTQNGNFTYSKISGTGQSSIIQYLLLGAIVYFGYRLYKKVA